MNYNQYDNQLVDALGDVTNDSQIYFQTEKSRNELMPNSGDFTIEDYSSVENQFEKENKLCPDGHLDSRLDTLNQMLNGEQNYTGDDKGNQYGDNSQYLFSGINSSVAGKLDSHTRVSNDLIQLKKQFQESRDYNYQHDRNNTQQTELLQNNVSNHSINNFYKQSPEKQTIQSCQKSLVSLQNLDQVNQNTLKIEAQTNSHGWIKRMYAGENSSNSNSNHVRRTLEDYSQNQSRGDIRCPRPKNSNSLADQNEFDDRSQQSLQIKSSFKQSAIENSHSGKPPIRLSLRHSSRAPSGHTASIEHTEVEYNEKNIEYQQYPIKLSQFGDSSRRETDGVQSRRETDGDVEHYRSYEVHQPRNPPARAFSEKCLSEPYQADLQAQNSVFTQSSTHLIENNGYQTENEVPDSKHVTLAYGGGTENQTQTKNQNPTDQTQESFHRKQSVGHISFTSGQRQFSNWMTGKHQQYLKDLQLNSNFGQNLLQKVRPDQAGSRIDIEETMSNHPVVYSKSPYIKPITESFDNRSKSSDILSGGQMQRSKINYLPQEISMEETETRSYTGLSDHRIQKQPSDNRIQKQPSATIQNEKNYRNILNDLSTRTYEREQDQNKYKNKTQLNMHRSFERQDNHYDRSLMNKQNVTDISNRTSDLQRDLQPENSEEPGPDRKAVIRHMVSKNSRNLGTLSSQETNDQAVRLSQLFKKKEQINSKRQAHSTSVEIPSRRPLVNSFADQNPDKLSQDLHQTSKGKVNIGVLRKLQQMQVERRSYDQVQFKEQTKQKPEEIYMLPVTSLSESYDKRTPNIYGDTIQDYRQKVDEYPTFSPVHTTTQQSRISSVQKSRITRYKQIERDLRDEREETQRQEEIRLQQEETYRHERAAILRQHYQQQQMEAPKPNYYQESVQNEYQPENQWYVEQRKEIQPYKNVQHPKIHSFANSPGLQMTNFSVGIIAPGDNPLVNQPRQDNYQAHQGQFQSAESLKDSNFTLGGESEKNIIHYQDWNDPRQPLVRRMGTAMFGEQMASQQRLSYEQLNQAMSREVKNRYSNASFEQEFLEEENSLLQNSSSQFQIIRKPWNSRERNQCNSRERNFTSQNIQDDSLCNATVQDDFVQNYQNMELSREDQSKKEQSKLTNYVQYNKEVQLQKEMSGKQYSQERNQRREVPETQYKPSIPQMRESLDKQYSKERKNYSQQFSQEQNLRKEAPEIFNNQQIPNVRESFDKQQYSNYNKRIDSQGRQNNLSDSFDKFTIRDIYAKRELNSQSQETRVQDKQYVQQVQPRENNFQRTQPIEEPIDKFYGQFIEQDRQTIQQEKEAFVQRYEKLMQKQALIREQAAKFSNWKSDSGHNDVNQTSFDNNQSQQLVTSFENNKTILRLSKERKFDHNAQSMPQTNHKQLIVQSIETNNNYQTDNITVQNTYLSNLKNKEVVRLASSSPVTLTRMQLKSSFGQKAVNQAKNEHQPETSIERIKRLVPPHEAQQLQSENQNTQKFMETFSPEVSFAPQQIHSYLARVHHKLPDMEAKSRVDEVRQEVHRAVTNLNSTLESQGLVQQKQKSNNLDYQPMRVRNEKIQQQYVADYSDREEKQLLQLKSLKSLPESSQFIDERYRILSFDNNPLLGSTITSFQPPKAMSAVETICYHNQQSKLSFQKQDQNQSEHDDRSTEMQIKTVSSEKFEQQKELFSESSKMAKMRQSVMESQKVAPDVKELIQMQFLQAQMLMDLHKQFMQASAIEEGSVEYQTENENCSERSQDQVQNCSDRNQQQLLNVESYESQRNASQKQLETVNSICKSMRDAEVQADYDFSVHSKSTVSKYFDIKDVQCYQDNLSQYDPKNLSAYHQRTQSNMSQQQKSQSMQSQKSQQTQSKVSQQMQSQRIISQTGSQPKSKQNSSYKHATQSYGSQQQSGQKSSQLLLNLLEVAVPQNQFPGQQKAQYIPRSIHDNISDNLSKKDLQMRQFSHASLQFLDSRISTLQQPGFILSNTNAQIDNQLNESQFRGSRANLKSVCGVSAAGVSQISQTKEKTLTLISKIYQMIEKIDKHVAAKEVLDEVRFLDMQKRMFKLARKYKNLKDENQILLQSHRGEPESYDSSIRGRIPKKHNFSIQDEESGLIVKINEKNKGTLTERILPTHQ